MWKDGGTDQSSNGQTYGTKAGKSYGGHNPCKPGWNLPECTEPWNASPHPGKNKNVEHFIFCVTLLTFFHFQQRKTWLCLEEKH